METLQAEASLQGIQVNHKLVFYIIVNANCPGVGSFLARCGLIMISLQWAALANFRHLAGASREANDYTVIDAG